MEKGKGDSERLLLSAASVDTTENEEVAVVVVVVVVAAGATIDEASGDKGGRVISTSRSSHDELEKVVVSVVSRGLVFIVVFLWSIVNRGSSFSSSSTTLCVCWVSFINNNSGDDEEAGLFERFNSPLLLLEGDDRILATSRREELQFPMLAVASFLV